MMRSSLPLLPSRLRSLTYTSGKVRPTVTVDDGAVLPVEPVGYQHSSGVQEVYDLVGVTFSRGCEHHHLEVLTHAAQEFSAVRP